MIAVAEVVEVGVEGGTTVFRDDIHHFERFAAGCRDIQLVKTGAERDGRPFENRIETYLAPGKSSRLPISRL
jgi:hypothetical protein